MFKIRDGLRELTIEGTLLSESSSFSPNKPRWIEFKLFKTNSGVYVISRVGYSTLFHDGTCKVVSRNHLAPVLAEDLPQGTYSPCSVCEPIWFDPNGVFPEKPRPHALVCQSADGVIEYLTKEDTNGSTYLTNVARRLLEDASAVDKGIYDAYMTEVIN